MINFTNLTTSNIDFSTFKNLGEKILRQEGIDKDEEINCIFTDNSTIQELNRKYRGIDMPTDVLSFSFIEGENSGYRDKMFGDVYISVQMAEQNAKRYKHNLFEELKLLFVHGILHLLGYKDEHQKDRKQMKEKESFYLSQG
ncbi:MAG: rRNA maturation RNase YbeY [Candidatus Cloacimonas sp. 4484_209]|nr:MAG: rRNA maturation RNase YbeY [Candidatus Cloacimonas sp. 4484_209]